jgi:DNA-directed RNA polymerase specialized sigma24 family protein
MTYNDIINIVANHQQYKRFCKKLCKGNNTQIHDDLYQEFILCILEYDKDKIIDLHNRKELECFCLSIIFRINSHRIKPPTFNPCNAPLYELSNFTTELTNTHKQESYNLNIDINANKILDYVSKDKSIKVEDWLLLTESLDRSLIDISKESGIPYITLKVKRKRLKDKIRKNVNI